MDIIFSTKLEFPLIEVILLLAFSTVFLLSQRIKLALITNYLFVLYWGYIFNRNLFFSQLGENTNTYISLYFGFGLIVAMLSMIGFLRSDN